ncbi:MAG: ketopantoate reductase family protein [Vampirovibrionales bacterium]
MVSFQRIAIVGAGAVGSFIGGLLQQAFSHQGHGSSPQLTLVARGTHAHAMQQEGLHVVGTMQGASLPCHVRVHVVNHVAELPPQDLIFITVKGFSLEQAAQEIAPLCHADTVIVPIMNGLSYWYLHGKPLYTPDGHPITSLQGVDPHGHIARCLPLSQTLGAVIHVPAELIAPGRVQVLNDARLFLGEPDPTLGISSRVQAVAALFAPTGLCVKPMADIRQEVWRKLLINLSLAPTSVLTEATYGDMLRDPTLASWLFDLASEAKAVGLAASEDIALLEVESIHAKVLETIADHRSSMLQDALRGKPLELGVIVESVVHLGVQLGVSCPTMMCTLAMVQLLTKMRDARRGEA